MRRYNVKYDLGGGVAVNPEVYTESDSFTLGIPLRYGYRFIGWTGTDTDKPLMKVTVPKGSRGDREYTAHWEKKTTSPTNPNIGADDGLLPPSAPVIPEVRKGSRGEDIYKLKTVYTDIEVDGVKDAAYDYGLHVRSTVYEAPEYYKDKDTGFDAYLTLGQDGYVYVFVEVTDPDVYVPDELWKSKNWRVDGISLFVSYDNQPIHVGVGCIYAADGRRANTASDKHAVVRTEKGYNVEFRFNNQGSPFIGCSGVCGSSIGFSVYMSDCIYYENLDNYKKYSIMADSALTRGGEYRSPHGSLMDALEFSYESATGRACDTDGGSASGKCLISAMIASEKDNKVLCSRYASIHTKDCIRRFICEMQSVCQRFTTLDDSGKVADADIVFGLTDESRAIADTVPYGNYAMVIADNRICVIGHTESAMERATELLLAAFEYVSEGGSTDDLCRSYIGETDSVSVPFADRVTAITDAGSGSYLLLCKKSDEEAYRRYTEKLKDNGYTRFAEREFLGTLCSTYVNEASIVNVTYGGECDPDLRIVADSRKKSGLPQIEENREKKNAPRLIQQGHNAMCYILKLENGEFLIFDSGNNGAEGGIYDTLMSESDDGRPVVAAWFFTHYHQDHIGGFIDLASNSEYLSRVTVKRVVMNMPAGQVIGTSGRSPRDMKNVELWQGCLENTGCEVIFPRTGQRYSLGGADVDILLTFEDIQPHFFVNDQSNATSTVYSVRAGGQHIIITGDCETESTRLMADKYREGLKCDFMQLPHHGHGSGGGTVPEFYENARATYILYPSDKFAPMSTEKVGVDMAKRYFLTDKGNVCFDLPYNE